MNTPARKRGRDDQADDPWPDYCSECFKGGHLLCCDLCPRAFHPKCVGLHGIPAGDWCCEHCHLQRNTAQEGNTVNGLEARYYAVLQRVREQLEHGGTALSYFVKEVLPRLEQRQHALQAVRHSAGGAVDVAVGRRDPVAVGRRDPGRLNEIFALPQEARWPPRRRGAADNVITDPGYARSFAYLGLGVDPNRAGQEDTWRVGFFDAFAFRNALNRLRPPTPPTAWPAPPAPPAAADECDDDGSGSGSGTDSPAAAETVDEDGDDDAAAAEGRRRVVTIVGGEAAEPPPPRDDPDPAEAASATAAAAEAAAQQQAAAAAAAAAAESARAVAAAAAALSAPARELASSLEHEASEAASAVSSAAAEVAAARRRVGELEAAHAAAQRRHAAVEKMLRQLREVERAAAAAPPPPPPLAAAAALAAPAAAPSAAATDPPSAPSATLVLWAAACLKHFTHVACPETPARLRAVISEVEELQRQRPHAIVLHSTAPEAPLKYIHAVHAASYVQRLAQSAPAAWDPPVALGSATMGGGSKWAAGERRSLRKEGAVSAPPAEAPRDMETFLSAESLPAARAAAGAVIAAVRLVLSGRHRNAFAAVRPPGHHAGRHGAALGADSQGFCLLNHVAIGARFALLAHAGIERVAIIDFDVHHGNGTEELFSHDPSVLVASVHVHDSSAISPFYPASSGGFAPAGDGATCGRCDEWAEGGGGGALNAPLPRGAGVQAFRHAFESVLCPRVEKFAPQLILLSAGFDAHAEDPLGGAHDGGPALREDDFAWLTARAVALADRVCSGRLVSVLEGGYQPQVLRRCVRAHVLALAGERA